VDAGKTPLGRAGKRGFRHAPRAIAQDFAQFRAGLASHPRALIEACQQALATRVPLDTQDRHLLASLLEIDAALRLQSPPAVNAGIPPE
jgi:hypothetical protein